MSLIDKGRDGAAEDGADDVPNAGPDALGPGWAAGLAMLSGQVDHLSRTLQTVDLDSIQADSPTEVTFLDGLDDLAQTLRRIEGLKFAVASTIVGATRGPSVAQSLPRRVGRRSPAALVAAVFGIGLRRAIDWVHLAEQRAEAEGPTDVADALAEGMATFEQIDTIRRELRNPAPPTPGLPAGVPDPMAREAELHALAGRALTSLATGRYTDATEHSVSANALADESPADGDQNEGAGEGEKNMAPTDVDALVHQALGSDSDTMPVHWSHPFGVDQLRKEARTWSAVLSPAQEEANEVEQFDRRRLDLTELADGSWRISGRAPKLEGAVLTAFIDAATAPRATSARRESSPAESRPAESGSSGSVPSESVPATSDATGTGTGTGSLFDVDPADAANAEPDQKDTQERKADPSERDGRTRAQIAFDVFYLLARRHVSGGTSTTPLRPAATLVVTSTLEALSSYLRERTATDSGRGPVPVRPSPSPSPSPTPTPTPTSIDPHRLPANGHDLLRLLADRDFALTSRSDRPLSLAATMELWCAATVELCITDGKGQPLILHQLRREFTAAQKRVLWTRDHHCRAPGCTMPAMWCESHHAKHWKQGGGTDVDNGILLCPAHHHELHVGRLRLLRRTPTLANPTPWRVVLTYNGILDRYGQRR